MNKNIDLIKNNKSVALLAPTFILDFKFPEIIGMLRHLGFDEVTELTFGAKMVNWHYAEYVKNHPKQKHFIASPCPTVVTFIQSQYPELKEYLMPIVSPLIAMARFYKKNHPDYKVIFISPCYAKKTIEAPLYPEDIDLVIPLSELKEIFTSEEIREEDFHQNYSFDSLVQEQTKIYPVSGGLASTSHIQKLFKEGEILITDGIVNIKKELDEIKQGTSKYKFLDFLNCPGGCIGGPAINNKGLSVEDKKEIVKNYIKKALINPTGKHSEKIDRAKDVDMSANY